MKCSIFWDKTPCSPLTVLAICFVQVSCLDYSSTLEMEATLSSETSVDFQRTPRRYTCILEDITFHNHRCMNLRFF
jgi:hypothetical protein